MIADSASESNDIAEREFTKALLEQILLWLSNDLDILITLIDFVVQTQELNHIFKEKGTFSPDLIEKIIDSLEKLFNSMDSDVVERINKSYTMALSVDKLFVLDLITNCAISVRSRKSDNREYLKAWLPLIIATFVSEDDMSVATQLISATENYSQGNHNLSAWSSFVIAKTGDLEKSLHFSDKALGLNSKSKMIYFYRGNILKNAERFDDALDAFSSAIKLRDEFVLEFAQRGQTYLDMEKYDEAVRDFTRAIELNENYTWAFAQRGVAHRDMEKYNEAIKDFTRAIELNENYGWAIGGRGLAYYLMGKFEQSLQDFNRRIELDEANLWNLAWRGEVYRSMGAYDLALIDLTKVIESSNADIDDIVRRASIFVSLGDIVSAQKDLEYVLSYDCKEPGDHYAHGLALILSNRISESFAEFDLAFVRNFVRSRASVDNLLDPIRNMMEFKILRDKHK
ncbi:MAG: tetratricopeptide repeat protein [Anaerolineae bacterium]|nr:tetratricopeptide repeat protein [Anaerolineae bacterium]